MYEAQFFLCFRFQMERRLISRKTLVHFMNKPRLEQEHLESVFIMVLQFVETKCFAVKDIKMPMLV